MLGSVFEQDADGKAADVGTLSGAEEQASPSQKTSCRVNLKDLEFRNISGSGEDFYM